MFTTLKKLLGKRRPSHQRRAASSRPTVECLEDRRLMTGGITAAAGLQGGSVSYVWGEDVLDLFNGSKYQSTIVDPTMAQLHKGIAQVSSGVHGAAGFLGPASAPFVLFGDGEVDEFYQSATGWASYKVAGQGSGVSEISASQITVDAVFLRAGAVVQEHVGASGSGSSFVTGPGWLKAPVLPLANPTQISAGKDGATGKEAVFVSFGGSRLWEHTGSSPVTGWSPVATNMANVTNFSASQCQGDTVFYIQNGWLYESVKGVSTPFLKSGVTQVSAGVDSSGHAAAFFIDSNQTLWEHTGMSAFGGWTNIAAGVTSMDAAQGFPDTVYYRVGQWGEMTYEFWEHSGQHYTEIVNDDAPH